ncbi:hypothetical protein G9C98_002179, partial [Cotesia typhae]
MRRGSVNTWESFGRRNSENMAQFSSNRHEFMTSEPGMSGIEYQREGGFFLSHRKLAIVITAIFLLLVAVGFIGAYAGAFPRKKIEFDTTALIAEDEGSEPADAEKYSLSKWVFPSSSEPTIKMTENNNEDDKSTIAIDELNIEEINITESKVDEAHGILTITPISGIKLGNYSLEIIYEVQTDNRTLLVANFSDRDADRWVMASRLKPTNARRLVPIFDNVKLKARFVISIAHPIGMVALSNTRKIYNASLPNNWVVDTFEETPPLSPHSIAVIQGHLTSVSSRTIKSGLEKGEVIQINFWSEKGENLIPSYLHSMINQVIISFQQLFSVKFPMNKLDIVSVPFADNSGNPGLISIMENLFNVSDTSPGVTKYETLKTLIRLIGRQWLGGSVNSQNWTDVWILESSLIDLQHYFVKKIDTTFNHTTFLLDVQLEAFESDGYSVSQSLKSKVNPEYLEAFHPEELYYRGACLLHMLHGVLKQNDSRTGYRKFVSRWSNGNGDVNSFLEAITNNDDNNNPDSVSLINVMESWINSHGYPVVFINRDYKTATAKITQVCFFF